MLSVDVMNNILFFFFSSRDCDESTKILGGCFKMAYREVAGHILCLLLFSLSINVSCSFTTFSCRKDFIFMFFIVTQIRWTCITFSFVTDSVCDRVLFSHQ